MPAVKQYLSYEWFTVPNWLKRWGPLKLVPASLLDRMGLHYFTIYASLTAVLAGTFSISGVILKKHLGANELQIALFASLAAVSLLLGIFGSELVDKRDKRPYILWLGIISRGAFLAFALCTGSWFFIIISAVYFLVNALAMPGIFSMWQANVSSEARSRLWGLTVCISTVITMASGYTVGLILDWNPEFFRLLFPLAGVVSILAIILLSISPLRGQYKLTLQREPISLNRLLIKPIRSFLKLLSTDRRFARFEAAFFLYGIALMLMWPIIPIYMVDVAHMSYQEASIAGIIIAQVTTLFLPPLWGRLMDRTGPQFLCAVIFAILALFPLTLLAGPFLESLGLPLRYSVYISHFFLGVGMSGVHVAWSIGPIAFAGNKDASGYSGAHVTLTGIRGTFAPLLGALGLKYMGYDTVFIASAACFLVGSLWMAWIVKRHGFLRTSEELTAET